MAAFLRLGSLSAATSDFRLRRMPVQTVSTRFHTDTDKELEMVRDYAVGQKGLAAIGDHWAKGGEGAVELANAVVEACKQESKFKFLYELERPLIDKMNEIVRRIYGGEGVELSEMVVEKIAKLEKQISTMPGLPTRPAYYEIDVDTETGQITGLF
eukprot:sb/3473139/